MLRLDVWYGWAVDLMVLADRISGACRVYGCRSSVAAEAPASHDSHGGGNQYASAITGPFR